MNRLSWLKGEWDGKGMLGSPAGEISQVGGWTIASDFGGAFLRLEFDAEVDGGKSENNRFVGYFTYDAEKEHYRTVWLNVDSYYQFNETGTLDDAGGVLTLISEQTRKDGTKVKVRSVFTRLDADHVRVEDHRLDEKGEPVNKTFGFELTRKK